MLLNPKKSLAVFLAASAATLFSLDAGAAPIQFIYTGTGTGSIGQVSFRDAAVTITEQSDTSGLQSCNAGCVFIDALSTSISIGGLGTYSFLTGTRTFDNEGRVGFSRASHTGKDLYDIFNVGLSYDMMSSIGPIVGTPNFLQWESPDVVTDGGVLVIIEGSATGTFQAVTSAVPVPAAAWLLGSGLLGLIGVARRQRA